MIASNFAFVSTKIKALQKFIPDKTDIERMVDAKDFESAFRVFNDTDYSDNLLDVAPTDYYKALQDDLKQLKIFLVKLVPEPRLTRLLLISEDYNNIKILLKSKFGDIPYRIEELSTVGNYNPVLLHHCIEHNDPSDLDDVMKESMKIVMSEITSQTTSHEIDRIVDKQYFASVLSLAQSIKNGFIKRSISLEIDKTNIITVLRCKKLGKDKDYVVKELIDGGMIDVKELNNSYSIDDVELIKILNKHADVSLKSAYEKYLENKNIHDVELALTRSQEKFYVTTRYVTYGPEIVWRYVTQKLNAIRNIRLIMIGKLNGVDPGKIKENIIL